MEISHDTDRLGLYVDTPDRNRDRDVVVADAFELPEEDASDHHPSEAEESFGDADDDEPRRSRRPRRDEPDDEESVLSEEIEDPNDPQVQVMRATLLAQIRVYQKKKILESERPDESWTCRQLNSLLLRMKTHIAMAQASKYGKLILYGTVMGIEFGANKIEPFGVNLDGWAQRVFEEGDSYDDVITELYIKYASDVAMQPETKLALMLMSSAAMHKLNMPVHTSFEEFLERTTGVKTSGAEEPQRQMRPPTLDNNDLLQSNAFHAAPAPETPQPRKRRRKRDPVSMILEDE